MWPKVPLSGWQSLSPRYTLQHSESADRLMWDRCAYQLAKSSASSAASVMPACRRRRRRVVATQRARVPHHASASGRLVQTQPPWSWSSLYRTAMRIQRKHNVYVATAQLCHLVMHQPMVHLCFLSCTAQLAISEACPRRSPAPLLARNEDLVSSSGIPT